MPLDARRKNRNAVWFAQHHIWALSASVKMFRQRAHELATGWTFDALCLCVPYARSCQLSSSCWWLDFVLCH